MNFFNFRYENYVSWGAVMWDFPNFLFYLQSFVLILEDKNPISWGDCDNPIFIRNKFRNNEYLN